MYRKMLLRAIGGAIGVIGLLTLISKSPVIVAVIAIGAVVYFVGDKLL